MVSQRLLLRWKKYLVTTAHPVVHKQMVARMGALWWAQRQVVTKVQLLALAQGPPKRRRLKRKSANSAVAARATHLAVARQRQCCSCSASVVVYASPTSL